jgi:hypothetical protein
MGRKLIDVEILADYIAENDMEFQYAIEHQDRKELESLIEKIPDYPCAECIEAGGCPIREDCPNEGKKKSKSDMIVERLEERTAFLKDCTKYGNKTAEQQEKSYGTMMMYEVADLVDDLIEIVKGGGADAN